MPISAAIAKYGAGNFQIEQLAVCVTREELNAEEVRQIALLGTRTPRGYNCTKGGEGTAGITRSQDYLAKKSEEAKRRWADPEWRAANIAKMKGRKASPERRKQISEFMKARHASGACAHLNKPRTKEQNEAMGQRIKSSWANPDFRAKMQNRRTAEYTPELREKMSQRAKKRQSSPEYRAKMAASITEWWRKRKEAECH